MDQGEFPGSAGIDHFVRTKPWLVMLALMTLAAILLWPYRHFAGDDAYITFRFARNLAAGSGFSFNPGVPVYGSTAPLWVFAIAAVHLLGLGVPAAAHTLNWLFLLANVVIFFQLAGRYLGRSSALVVATVLLVADPWFVRWSLSGMENGLALFLLMSLLISQNALRNRGIINWVSPIAAGLAGLCRPEMNLLAGLLVLDILLFERRRKAANILVTLIICAAILFPWLWYAQHEFGSIIPTTIKAKLSALHLLSLGKTLEYFCSFWPFQACAAAVVGFAAWRSGGAAALTARMRAAPQWFLVLAWAAILPAFYIVGGAPVAGRYMMFGLPCYLIIGVRSWSILSARFPRLVLAAMVCTVLLIAWVQYRYCWYVTRWPQGMDAKMISLATTLKRESTPTSVVAGDQIGVLGYFSDRVVLDTYGLASPEILAHRGTPGDPAPLWQYVYERRPQFLFVIDTIDTLSKWNAAYQSLTLVQKEEVQREGAGAAGVPVTYYLYRTNW